MPFTSSFGSLLAVLCLFLVTISSAPLPGTVVKHDSNHLWTRGKPGLIASLKASAPSSKSLITASLAIKRAHVGTGAEHWILLVDTGKAVLAGTDVDKLKALNPVESKSLTATSSAKLSIHGRFGGASKPLEGDIQATPADVGNPALKIGKATFAKKTDYLDWLASINGKRPLEKQVTDIEGNCIEFIGWALKGLKTLPKADLAKWEAYKSEWNEQVHAAVHGVKT